MYLQINDTKMLDWLKQQVIILEAWREELACRCEIEISTVTRLEKHYAWLTSQIVQLEQAEARY